jgi:hypothetical protein
VPYKQRLTIASGSHFFIFLNGTMLFSMEIEERSVCKWTFRARADPTKHPHFADHCLSFVPLNPDIDGFPVNR